jgi:ribosomal protein S18 acetylase RimI-like enzyme
MIRDAQLSDVPRLVEMGQRFIKETSYSKHLRDNPECAAVLITSLIEKGSLLILEQGQEIIGMLGFVMFPHFMSGDLTAGEIFWWVEPEHRGQGLKLLREMERRARVEGAKYVQMVAPNEKVGRLYERLGFDRIETSYQRAL